INVKLQLNDADNLIGNETAIRTLLSEDGFSCNLQINNHSRVEKTKKNGSLIDIDTFQFIGQWDGFDQLKQLLEKGHTVEKKLFFRILREDYLKTLNPEYE